MIDFLDELGNFKQNHSAQIDQKISWYFEESTFSALPRDFYFKLLVYTYK